MINDPARYDHAPSLWSAVINGHCVRLVSNGAGSGWLCDCDEFKHPKPSKPPSCEHIQFGFDIWFGRKPNANVVVTDIDEGSGRR